MEVDEILPFWRLYLTVLSQEYQNVLLRVFSFYLCKQRSGCSFCDTHNVLPQVEGRLVEDRYATI